MRQNNPGDLGWQGDRKENANYRPMVERWAKIFS
jgi:hypothetical protein